MALGKRSSYVQLIDYESIWWIKYALGLVFVLALVALVLGLTFPLVPAPTPSTNHRITSVVDAFAKTITHKDIPANLALFAPNATVDYRRLMVFLFPPNILQADSSTGNWGEQLDVFLGEFITNHMTFSNCNTTNISDVQCLGYYTYTFDSNTLNLPSVVGSFSAKFVLDNHFKIVFAEALPNATSTFIWYSSSGVEPPGPVLVRKKRSLATDTIAWNTLQRQIATLIANGQTQQALSVCNTTQYLTLKAIFDPLGTNSSLPCNTLVHQTDLTVPMVCSEAGMFDQSCFPPNLVINALTVTNLTAVNLISSNNMTNMVFDGEFQCGTNFSFADTCSVLQTINAITPLANDFSLIGGPGIQMTGNMHSLTITNLGVLSVGLSAPTDEFDVTVSPVNNNTGTLTFVKKQQLQNLIWASPVNQTGVPVFRALDTSDLPSSIPANLITGVISVANGGTGTAGPFAPNQIIVSSANGTHLTTGSLIPSFGINITNLGNGSFAFGVNTTLVTLLKFQEVRLAVPTDIFNVTVGSVTQNGTLTFVTLPQAQHTFWAGSTAGGPSVPSFRVIQQSDLPALNLTDLSLIGVLPLANGGTGSGIGTLIGNRIILSSNSGDAMVEGPALLNGQVFIGSAGNAPVAAVPTGSNGITVSTSPGSFDISMTSAPTFSSLSVTGVTTLGNTTTCASALNPSCISISNQACPLGPLSNNCIPTSGLHLTDLTVENLIALNFTQMTVGIFNGSSLSVDEFYVNNVHLMDNMVCVGNASIAPNCYDISNKGCPLGTLQESCIPDFLLLSSAQVTGALTINTLTCNGGPVSANCVAIDNKTCSVPIQDSCLPAFGKTINHIPPSTGGNNFNLIAGLGIAIHNGLSENITIINTLLTDLLPAGKIFGSLGPNMTADFRDLQLYDLPPLAPGYTYVGNTTGTISVGLSLPVSVFAITNSPVSLGNTGTLTGSFVSQSANKVFASPLGVTGIPIFRSLATEDLPALLDGQIYIGNTSSTQAGYLQAGAGIAITNGPGSILVNNTGLLSAGLSLPASVFDVTVSTISGPAGGTLTAALATQAANTFWGGPSTGSPATPTFRTLQPNDFAPLGMTDGQLIIGSTGGPPVVTNLIGGANINITNTPGGIIISGSINASAIGTVMSVDMTVPSALLSVTGGPVTTMGTFAVSLNTQSANKVFASPDGASGTPNFRSLAYTDFPLLPDGQVLIGFNGTNTPSTLTAGTGVSIANNGASTVISTNISVGLSLPGSIFSVSGSPVTSSGTLTGTLTTQLANKVFAGPASGSTAAPTFRSLVPLDLPSLGDGQMYIGSGGIPSIGSLAAGTGITITPGMGTVTITAINLGTVTSVGLSLPSIFSVSGSPVTASGTLTGTLASQSANTVFAAPNGASGTPTFRSLVPMDIPNLDTSKLTSGVLPIARGGTNSNATLANNRIMVSSGGAIVEAGALTNGQLLIGSTGVAPVPAAITGTTNQVSVTNGAGTITLSTPQNIHTGATPTFASETLSATTNQLTLGTTNTATISATAPAASRTYTIADPGASANFVMDTAGPLVITNTPLIVGQVLTATSGTTATWQNATGVGGGSGTVTSVGLSLPSIFTVSGSPVTTSGTLTGTLASQSANTVFAAPDGASGTPTFRSLVAADIPNHDTSKLTTGTLPIARGGTNSSTALNNNRIMVSSGGAIVEAAALTNGQLLIGSTGAAPVPTTLTAGSDITITNAGGSITIANTPGVGVNPDGTSCYYDEMYAWDTGTGGIWHTSASSFTVDASGANAQAAPAPVGFTTATNKALGAVQLTTGSSSTAGRHTGVSLASQTILFGIAQMTFTARVLLSAFPPTNNDYVRIGYIDEFAGASNIADGVFFTIDRTVSTTNWCFVASLGGTRTTINTGVAVSTTTFQKLQIQVNAAGTSAQAVINGVNAGSAITTNIPTATNKDTGMGFLVHRTTAGTQLTLSIDYLQYCTTFSGTR